MNNQLLLWSLLILPWLSLFFMKKENIKRFMPVALLNIVLATIILGIGESLKLWAIKEMAFPLRTLPYVLGLNPVVTMWIFRFTYGRFWLFIGTEIVLNLAFAYLFIGYLLVGRGILQFVGGSPMHTFITTTVHGILLYLYQMWQEGIYEQHYKKS